MEMNVFTILAAACLVGAPNPPERVLWIGVHPYSWQSRNLTADVQNDLWLLVHFKIEFIERSEPEPVWRTGRFGAWQKWPTSADFPNGPFCTPGFAASILRCELRKHLRQMERDPNWSYSGEELNGVPESIIAPPEDSETAA